MKLYIPKKKYKETFMYYENVTWDGILRNNLGRYIVLQLI